MSTSGVKPFSMQSPELIAKQYEGNKQKIAQAVQLGLVDATAGTLAGMFIDRMRSAAMQEQGAPQTVAQQVLGSGPPVPPPGGPPMAQQAGGPPPPPMPAPQGAPPASSVAPMGGPPVRAADGGLMSIPIPDTMFDEPSNGSYANGGLVAFANSGSTNAALDAASRGDDQGEEEIPFSESGTGRFFSGVRDALYLSPEERAADAARAKINARKKQNLLAQAFGGRYKPLTDEELSMQGGAPRAPKPNASAGIPDMRVEGTPKPKEGERFIGGDGRVYTQQAPKAPEAPDRKIADRTGVPRVGGGLTSLASSKSDKAAADKATATPPIAPTTVAEDLKMIQGLMQDPETKAYMDGQTERLAKQKKEDVWTTLAQIGFGMAASKSPTLLGAIGEAGTAALPAAQKALQARRAAEADFAKQRMEQRGRDVTTALGYNQNQTSFGIEREKMQQARELARDQIHAQLEIAERNNSTQLQAARISAERAGDTDYKWSISTKAAALFATGRYKTLGEATNAAMDDYLKTVHPTKTAGTPIADAFNKGAPAMPEGQWSSKEISQ